MFEDKRGWTFTLEEALLYIMDLYFSQKQGLKMSEWWIYLFQTQDVNWWTGVVWVTCVLLLSPHRPCDWTMLPSIINSTLRLEDQSDVRGARIKTRMWREFGRAFCFSFVCSPTSRWVLLLILVVVFCAWLSLCETLLFICCDAVTRLSVYPSLFKSFSTWSDGTSQHVTWLTSYYTQGSCLNTLVYERVPTLYLFVSQRS